MKLTFIYDTHSLHHQLPTLGSGGTLFPKLLPGEFRIHEVEKLTEQALS